MAEIKTVRVGLIDPNPYRNLHEYPWIEDKIKTLQRSIETVGFWEGVIARPKGKRYELAFGHHRLEAARRSKLKEIPIIVRDLTDEQMMLFMGRENSEDYHGDFLTMLNTWEGAIAYSRENEFPEDIQSISALLGWGHKSVDYRIIKPTLLAYTCWHVSTLLSMGFISKEDLVGLSARALRDPVSVAVQRLNEVERAGEKNNRGQKEVEAMKVCVGKAVKRVLQRLRRGEVAQLDARNQVTVEIHRYAARMKQPAVPLFENYSKGLIQALRNILETDASAKRLEEIDKVLDVAEFAPEDQRIIENIIYELGEIANRAAAWKKKMESSSSVSKIGSADRPVAIGEMK